MKTASLRKWEFFCLRSARKKSVAGWILICIGALPAIAASPTIGSINPGAGSPGTSVAITGSDFSSTPASNIVYFGAVKAVVSAASANSLTTTVPVGATYAPVTVTVNGLTAYANAPYLVTFPGTPGINATSLASRVNFNTGNLPPAVAIGDLDGDGKPDLVVANYGSANISVYRNTSTSGGIDAGSLAAKVDFATGNNPRTLAIADLDGDGKLDLAIVNEHSLTLYRNTSTPGSITAASFAPPVDIATGATPVAIAVQDLDGDGRPDLALVNAGNNGVSVHRNTSTVGSLSAGSFAARVDFATGSGARRLAVGDLDEDGKADLAVVNTSANTVSILQNTSTIGAITAGSFAAKVDFATPTGASGVAIGDLDGDGKLDLAGTSYVGSALWLYRNTSTVGTLNASSFGARVDFATASRLHTVAIGDLDGDGKPDLAVVGEASSRASVYRNVSTAGSLTASSFAPQVNFATGDNPADVVIGDVDGDSKPELILVNYYNNTLSIYRNTVPSMMPPPAMVMYDLSKDFSLTSNPNGVWSYGAKPSLDGPFSIFSYRDRGFADNGVPVEYWELVPQAEPVIQFNATTNTAIAFGGRAVFPPGTVTLFSGRNDQTNEFGVVRFMVPAGGGGTYRVETTVRHYLTNWPQGDTDFHVLKNTTELFGQGVSAGGATGYTNTLILVAGDKVEFLVGRGADHSGDYSGLNIRAKLTLESSNAPPPSCVSPAAGLVSWWPAQSNANDVADGNHGALQGGLGFGTGKVGQAFNFDGMNDFVSMPASANLDVGAGNGFTFECWISPATLTGGPLAEWRRDVFPGAGAHFWISPNGAGQLLGNLVDTSGNSHVFTSPAGVLTANSLQHVAMTYDRTTGLAKMYRNGMVVAQQNLGSFRPDTTRELRLGARPVVQSGSTYFYAGVMDEAALYNRVLSESEIAAIFNADVAGKCPTSPPPAMVMYDLAADFSLTSNPNGPWSFGAKPTLNGPFSIFGLRVTGVADNGVPVEYWLLVPQAEPLIQFNATSNTAIGFGGRIVVPPGSVTLFSGRNDQTNEFGVVRFTVPTGGSGTYRVETAVRDYINNWPQGDTDFHVLKNATELFGQQLPADGATSYSNIVVLSAGDHVEFLVGRGADHSGDYSALFITAKVSLVSSNPPPPACVPAPSGLVSWWPGQGNANDIADGNNGALEGGLAFGPGKVGQNFVFNGSNGYVRVAASANLNLGVRSGLTLEAWIQPANISTYLPLFEWSQSLSVLGAHFWHSQPPPSGQGPGCLFANLIDSNGNSHLISSPPVLTTNAFQHIALTYDKTTGLTKIYRNGQVVAQQNLGMFTPRTTSDLYLGARPFGSADNNRRYHGLMDEASVYNRALSDSEIVAIYNADAAGKCPPPPTPAMVMYDLSQEYSLASNPNGVWSYGWKSAVGGAFTLYGFSRQVTDEAGALVQVWARFSNAGGHIQRNGSNFEGGCCGGQGRFAPGQILLFPGDNSRDDNFGVARFTVPAGGAGTYEIRSSVLNFLNGSLSGDTDFHVVKNGVEAFGQFIPRNPDNTVTNGAGYTNTMALAAGDTVDFLAGRGLDGDFNGSGLKIQAKITLVSSNPPPPACVSPATGLVSWWPAEGNANDISDGNNGMLQGGLTFSTGKVGQAFVLNGTDAHIKVPASSNLNVGTSSGLTIEMWINPASVSSQRPLVEWNDASGRHGAHFWIAVNGSGSLFANLHDTAEVGHEITSATGILTPNSFQHVALTYDKTTGLARIYRNGIIVAQQNLGIFTPQTSFDLYLGRRQSSFPGIVTYSGQMDEVSLYNRALGSNEIAAIYNADAAGKCPPIPPPTCVPPAGSLVSWWPAQGNANDVADANNGMLQNGASFAAGKVGQAFQFNSNNAAVKIPASANLNVGAGSGLTMEAWIKPMTVSARGPLIEWNNGTGIWGVHLHIDPFAFGVGPGALYANIVDTGRSWHQIISPAGTLAADVFQHVALTYNKTTGLAKLYRNGAVVAQQNLGTFTPLTSFDLFLGTRPSGVPGDLADYRGLMDETAVYSRALSDAEIQAIYAADATGKCRQPSPPVPTGVRVVDVSAASGGTVDVPIELAAQGTENALGFSLNFDPSLLEFSNVALASDAPADAALIANVDQVNSGRLGVAVALPSGARFLAGTQQVVTVSFNVAPVLSGVTIPVTFGDQPTVRQVSDQHAQPLPAVFVDGNVTISQVQFEADTAPRPSGDGQLTIIDWVQVGRFVARLDTLGAGEFQRADCAPRPPRGNGVLSITDWVQAGRYAAGLDPLTAAGGPSSPSGPGPALGLASGMAATGRTLALPETNVPAGGSLIIPVLFQAQGGENAVGFSVLFDPAKLNFTSAAKGPGLTNALLNVNANEASAGKVGLALALPAMASMEPGSITIALLSFTVATNAIGSNTVAFSDGPILCEVSDGAANSLACAYSDGMIGFGPAVPSGPPLAIARSGGSIVLFWSASAQGFELWATADAFGSGWGKVGVTPVEIGGQKIVTMPITDQKYFRLQKP